MTPEPEWKPRGYGALNPEGRAKECKRDEIAREIAKTCPPNHGFPAPCPACWTAAFAVERARREEVEGREASLADLVNSWCRESGLVEAVRSADAKRAVERLWHHWSRLMSLEEADSERRLQRAEAAEHELHDILPSCGHERRFYEGGQLGECVRCRAEAAEARSDALVAALHSTLSALEGVIRQLPADERLADYKPSATAG